MKTLNEIYNMMERIDDDYRDYAILNEANRPSARKYTLEKDPAFFDELYSQAIEEISHEFKAAVDDHPTWYHEFTLDDWIRYNGGDNYVRSFVNKYKEALKDNATQVEYDAEY